jgi:hypothetical protein
VTKVNYQQTIFKHDRFVISHRSKSGTAAAMVNRGDNTYGGKYVINPSGGLISKGHPLGATGVS